MGKSLKNAIAPDEVCEVYGADTLRLYLMSMGPLDASRPWESKDVVGVHRFLQRLWRNIVDEETGALRLLPDEPTLYTLRALNITIAAVREELDNLRFNTAIDFFKFGLFGQVAALFKKLKLFHFFLFFFLF